MARHDGEFAPAGEPLSLDELLRAAGERRSEPSQRRQDAIACYLSAGEGWRDAVKELGGAFAEIEAGLRESKTD